MISLYCDDAMAAMTVKYYNLNLIRVYKYTLYTLYVFYSVNWKLFFG